MRAHKYCVGVRKWECGPGVGSAEVLEVLEISEAIRAVRV
jgi:hypothetical protein